MPFRLKPIKIIAVIISLVVLSTHVLFAHLPEKTIWDERRKPLTSPELRLPQLNLLQFGSLRSVKQGSGPAIIHIQDIHLNIEAQNQISGAIQSLVASGKADLIAVEGAWGEIDLRAFPAFPDQTIIRQTADHLLSENVIQGPLHALLYTPAPVIGIDDESHYRANIEAYRSALALQPRLKKEQVEESAQMTQRKAAIFNPALRDFDAQVSAYRNETIGLGEYVETLKYVQFPAMEKFREARRLEASLDFKRVEIERDHLVLRLSARLNHSDQTILTQLSAAFRAHEINHEEFYQALLLLCRKNGTPLDPYSELARYIRYIAISNSIDIALLIDELCQAEMMRYEMLALNAEERALIKESRRLFLIGKLLDFALTKEEWEETKNLELNDLKPFLSFYLEAEARDLAMANNLRAAIKKYDAKSVALITGGFHAKGIRSRISNVSEFFPRLSKIETASGSDYLSVFTQEKAPLDKIFAGEKLFLSKEFLTKESFQRLGLESVARLAKQSSLHLKSAQNWLASYFSWKDVAIELIENGVVSITGVYISPLGQQTLSLAVDTNLRINLLDSPLAYTTIAMAIHHNFLTIQGDHLFLIFLTAFSIAKLSWKQFSKKQSTKLSKPEKPAMRSESMTAEEISTEQEKLNKEIEGFRLRMNALMREEPWDFFQVPNHSEVTKDFEKALWKINRMLDSRAVVKELPAELRSDDPLHTLDRIRAALRDFTVFIEFLVKFRARDKKLEFTHMDGEYHQGEIIQPLRLYADYKFQADKTRKVELLWQYPNSKNEERLRFTITDRNGFFRNFRVDLDGRGVHLDTSENIRAITRESHHYHLPSLTRANFHDYLSLLYKKMNTLPEIYKPVQVDIPRHHELDKLATVARRFIGFLRHMNVTVLGIDTRMRSENGEFQLGIHPNSYFTASNLEEELADPNALSVVIAPLNGEENPRFLEALEGKRKSMFEYHGVHVSVVEGTKDSDEPPYFRFHPLKRHGHSLFELLLTVGIIAGLGYLALGGEIHTGSLLLLLGVFLTATPLQLFKRLKPIFLEQVRLLLALRRNEIAKHHKLTPDIFEKLMRNLEIFLELTREFRSRKFRLHHEFQWIFNYAATDFGFYPLSLLKNASQVKAVETMSGDHFPEKILAFINNFPVFDEFGYHPQLTTDWENRYIAASKQFSHEDLHLTPALQPLEWLITRPQNFPWLHDAAVLHSLIDAHIGIVSPASAFPLFPSSLQSVSQKVPADFSNSSARLAAVGKYRGHMNIIVEFTPLDRADPPLAAQYQLQETRAAKGQWSGLRLLTRIATYSKNISWPKFVLPALSKKKPVESQVKKISDERKIGLIRRLSDEIVHVLKPNGSVQDVSVATVQERYPDLSEEEIRHVFKAHKLSIYEDIKPGSPKARAPKKPKGFALNEVIVAITVLAGILYAALTENWAQLFAGLSLGGVAILYSTQVSSDQKGKDSFYLQVQEELEKVTDSLALAGFLGNHSGQTYLNQLVVLLMIPVRIGDPDSHNANVSVVFEEGAPVIKLSGTLPASESEQETLLKIIRDTAVAKALTQWSVTVEENVLSFRFADDTAPADPIPPNQVDEIPFEANDGLNLFENGAKGLQRLFARNDEIFKALAAQVPLAAIDEQDSAYRWEPARQVATQFMWLLQMDRPLKIAGLPDNEIESLEKAKELYRWGWPRASHETVPLTQIGEHSLDLYLRYLSDHEYEPISAESMRHALKVAYHGYCLSRLMVLAPRAWENPHNFLGQIYFLLRYLPYVEEPAALVALVGSRYSTNEQGYISIARSASALLENYPAIAGGRLAHHLRAVFRVTIDRYNGRDALEYNSSDFAEITLLMTSLLRDFAALKNNPAHTIKLQQTVRSLRNMAATIPKVVLFPESILNLRPDKNNRIYPAHLAAEEQSEFRALLDDNRFALARAIMGDHTLNPENDRWSELTSFTPLGIFFLESLLVASMLDPALQTATFEEHLTGTSHLEHKHDKVHLLNQTRDILKWLSSVDPEKKLAPEGGVFHEMSRENARRLHDLTVQQLRAYRIKKREGDAQAFLAALQNYRIKKDPLEEFISWADYETLLPALLAIHHLNPDPEQTVLFLKAAQRLFGNEFNAYLPDLVEILDLTLYNHHLAFDLVVLTEQTPPADPQRMIETLRQFAAQAPFPREPFSFFGIDPMELLYDAAFTGAPMGIMLNNRNQLIDHLEGIKTKIGSTLRFEIEETIGLLAEFKPESRERIIRKLKNLLLWDHKLFPFLVKLNFQILSDPDSIPLQRENGFPQFFREHFHNPENYDYPIYVMTSLKPDPVWFSVPITDEKGVLKGLAQYIEYGTYVDIETQSIQGMARDGVKDSNKQDFTLPLNVALHELLRFFFGFTHEEAEQVGARLPKPGEGIISPDWIIKEAYRLIKTKKPGLKMTAQKHAKSPRFGISMIEVLVAMSVIAGLFYAVWQGHWLLLSLPLILAGAVISKPPLIIRATFSRMLFRMLHHSEASTEQRMALRNTVDEMMKDPLTQDPDAMLEPRNRFPDELEPIIAASAYPRSFELLAHSALQTFDLMFTLREYLNPANEIDSFPEDALDHESTDINQTYVLNGKQGQRITLGTERLKMHAPTIEDYELVQRDHALIDEVWLANAVYSSFYATLQNEEKIIEEIMGETWLPREPAIAVYHSFLYTIAQKHQFLIPVFDDSIYERNPRREGFALLDAILVMALIGAIAYAAMTGKWVHWGMILGVVGMILPVSHIIFEGDKYFVFKEGSQGRTFLNRSKNRLIKIFYPSLGVTKTHLLKLCELLNLLEKRHVPVTPNRSVEDIELDANNTMPALAMDYIPGDSLEDAAANLLSALGPGSFAERKNFRERGTKILNIIDLLTGGVADRRQQGSKADLANFVVTPDADVVDVDAIDIIPWVERVNQVEAAAQPQVRLIKRTHENGQTEDLFEINFITLEKGEEKIVFNLSYPEGESPLPVAILMHGWQTSGADPLFTELSNILPERARIRPHFRNHHGLVRGEGTSDLVDNGNLSSGEINAFRWGESREDMVMIMEALRAHPELFPRFDFSDTVLIGHSYGGWSARVFATEVAEQTFEALKGIRITAIFDLAGPPDAEVALARIVKNGLPIEWQNSNFSEEIVRRKISDWQTKYVTPHVSITNHLPWIFPPEIQSKGDLHALALSEIPYIYILGDNDRIMFHGATLQHLLGAQTGRYGDMKPALKIILIKDMGHSFSARYRGAVYAQIRAHLGVIDRDNAFQIDYVDLYGKSAPMTRDQLHDLFPAPAPPLNPLHDLVGRLMTAITEANSLIPTFQATQNGPADYLHSEARPILHDDGTLLVEDRLTHTQARVGKLILLSPNYFGIEWIWTPFLDVALRQSLITLLIPNALRAGWNFSDDTPQQTHDIGSLDYFPTDYFEDGRPLYLYLRTVQAGTTYCVTLSFVNGPTVADIYISENPSSKIQARDHGLYVANAHLRISDNGFLEGHVPVEMRKRQRQAAYPWLTGFINEWLTSQRGRLFNWNNVSLHNQHALTSSRKISDSNRGFTLIEVLFALTMIGSIIYAMLSGEWLQRIQNISASGINLSAAQSEEVTAPKKLTLRKELIDSAPYIDSILSTENWRLAITPKQWEQSPQARKLINKTIGENDFVIYDGLGTPDEAAWFDEKAGTFAFTEDFADLNAPAREGLIVRLAAMQLPEQIERRKAMKELAAPGWSKNRSLEDIKKYFGYRLRIEFEARHDWEINYIRVVTGEVADVYEFPDRYKLKLFAEHTTPSEKAYIKIMAQQNGINVSNAAAYDEWVLSWMKNPLNYDLALKDDQSNPWMIYGLPTTIALALAGTATALVRRKMNKTRFTLRNTKGESFQTAFARNNAEFAISTNPTEWDPEDCNPELALMNNQKLGGELRRLISGPFPGIESLGHMSHKFPKDEKLLIAFLDTMSGPEGAEEMAHHFRAGHQIDHMIAQVMTENLEHGKAELNNAWENRRVENKRYIALIHEIVRRWSEVKTARTGDKLRRKGFANDELLLALALTIGLMTTAFSIFFNHATQIPFWMGPALIIFGSLPILARGVVLKRGRAQQSLQNLAQPPLKLGVGIKEVADESNTQLRVIEVDQLEGIENIRPLLEKQFEKAPSVVIVITSDDATRATAIETRLHEIAGRQTRTRIVRQNKNTPVEKILNRSGLTPFSARLLLIRSRDNSTLIPQRGVRWGNVVIPPQDIEPYRVSDWATGLLEWLEISTLLERGSAALKAA